MTAPQPGTALIERRIPEISAELMKVMAVVLKDPNVIHLDADAVRALGMGDRVINQGPNNIGYIIDMLAENFPGARLRRITARFLANVLGGDDVVAGGTVESIDEKSDHVEVVCAVWLEITGRGRAVDARATLRLAI